MPPKIFSSTAKSNGSFSAIPYENKRKHLDPSSVIEQENQAPELNRVAVPMREGRLLDQYALLLEAHCSAHMKKYAESFVNIGRVLKENSDSVLTIAMRALLQYRVNSCSCILVLDENSAPPKVIAKGTLCVQEDQSNPGKIKIYWLNNKSIVEKNINKTTLIVDLLKELAALGKKATKRRDWCQKITSICGYVRANKFGVETIRYTAAWSQNAARMDLLALHIENWFRLKIEPMHLEAKLKEIEAKIKPMLGLIDPVLLRDLQLRKTIVAPDPSVAVEKAPLGREINVLGVAQIKHKKPRITPVQSVTIAQASLGMDDGAPSNQKEVQIGAALLVPASISMG